MEQNNNQLVGKKQALQRQESTLQRTGDEETFFSVIKLPRLSASSLEEIKQVLRYVMMKIGLRANNWPLEEEKLLLIQHIVENYGNRTAGEIKLAFDMAMTGKLAVDVNHFENFSCLYFSSIMNAYRIWAEVVYKKGEKFIVIENKPDIEQIEKEYQDFLKTDIAKRFIQK